jgi:RNA polymerase sigma-70 factor, ECF subfamily
LQYEIAFWNFLSVPAYLIQKDWISGALMEDIEIIRRVKGGDTEAFAGLVEKYHKHLLNFIFRLVGDEQVVEDIGQEVFLSVYKSLKGFDEKRGTPFSAWLFMSARNRCITELRSKRGMEKVNIEDIDYLRFEGKTSEEMLLEKERGTAIQNSLEQLDEPYKSTILRSLQGDSMDDIAMKDGISTGTVKSRLFRAREKMKLLVKEYFGGIENERI